MTRECIPLVSKYTRCHDDQEKTLNILLKIHQALLLFLLLLQTTKYNINVNILILLKYVINNENSSSIRHCSLDFIIVLSLIICIHVLQQ